MLISFAVEDNRIVKNGEMRLVDLSPLAATGIRSIQFYTENSSGWVEKSLVNGTPQPQENITSLIAFQSYLDQYDIQDIPPVKTLDQVKAEKTTEISTERDNECRSDIDLEVNSMIHTFQADDRSQTLIMGAIVGYDSGATQAPSVWRSSSNVNVNVSIDDIKALAAAIIARTNLAYVKSWALKAQVDAATTIADVDAIKW